MWENLTFGAWNWKVGDKQNHISVKIKSKVDEEILFENLTSVFIMALSFMSMTTSPWVAVIIATTNDGNETSWLWSVCSCRCEGVCKYLSLTCRRRHCYDDKGHSETASGSQWCTAPPLVSCQRAGGRRLSAPWEGCTFPLWGGARCTSKYDESGTFKIYLGLYLSFLKASFEFLSRFW